MAADSRKLECDLVMKGGITSGVIYPGLVAALSSAYDFRSIGGTSAGAIAAGAAAAAQLGARSGANPAAFDELAKLPKLLGGPAQGASGSMLLNLFQPQKAFRRHFALLTGALDAGSGPLGGLRIALSAIARFPLGAILGALPGALIAWNSAGIARVLGLVFAALGLLIGAAVGALRSIGKHLPANNFGMCSGMPARPGAGAPAALSTWLHGYLNGLAGKPAAEPLTFGELWAARLRKPGEPAPADGTKAPEIELAMITTALNLGRPFRFPFEGRDLYFAKEEFETLLPREVVDWMVARARPSENAAKLSKATRRTICALPNPEDMPVLLGVRMSLSFPLLLSAIPLYAIDWTRKANEAGATQVVRILFSDGGICSNFPVHFFDGPLPSRPTFGVNLKAYHPDYPKDRTYLPPPLMNNRGLKTHIPDMPAAPGLGSVFGFLGFVVNTMQNWRDQVQVAMPGYRDRIVHVCHTEDEGGLNLNMKDTVITALSDGGVEAADKLRKAFVPGTDPAQGSWYNHRRIRMRTLLAGLDRKLRRIGAVIGNPGSPTWNDVVNDVNSTAYQFESSEHRQLAIDVLKDLAQIGERLEKSGIDLATGAPRPESEWRQTPRI